MLHSESHLAAGLTVVIGSGEFKGESYRLEDWWDRVSGMSWMYAKGNPACIKYAIRSALANLSLDDEVVYGKIGPFGHLIHVSEL